MKINRIEGIPLFVSSMKCPGWFILYRGFCIWLEGGGYVKVLSGVHANGATIPWILTFIFNRFHPYYNRAAWFHDPAVGEGGQPYLTAFIDGEHRPLTWRESAKIFKAIMIYDGAPKPLAFLFYEAVMLKKRPKKLYNNLKGIYYGIFVK